MVYNFFNKKARSGISDTETSNRKVQKKKSQYLQTILGQQI